MRLGFLLLADHSEALNGKIYAMGGGWNMLRFPQLPQDWGFSIAFGVDVPWDETNRPHTLNLLIEDPDGAPLGEELSLDFEAGRPPGSVVGQDQRIILSIVTRVTFSATGPHAVIIRVGGEELDRARFYVVEVPAEQFGQPVDGT